MTTSLRGFLIRSACAAGVAAMLGAAIGCQSAPDAVGHSQRASASPHGFAFLLMPQEVLDYERANQWGQTHLQWHITRRWNYLTPDQLNWAINVMGWSPAAVQEGGAGNGNEFLAMHHMMVKTLRTQFPQYAALLTGWTTPPISSTPEDPIGPLTIGDVAPAMQQAIQVLSDDSILAQIADDDTFGRFVETNFRPTPGNPFGVSTDPRAGLHNYLHVRFSEPGSGIDLGDPSVNQGNQIFWRLHGWIDQRWAAFRRDKGLPDIDAMDPQSPLGSAIAAAGAALSAGAEQPPLALPDDIRRGLVATLAR
jgi:hypothetical protein